MKNQNQGKFRKENFEKRQGPDDLVQVIGNNGLPIGTHGGSAFNGHDQLLLRHVPENGRCSICRNAHWKID